MSEPVFGGALNLSEQVNGRARAQVRAQVGEQVYEQVRAQVREQTTDLDRLIRAQAGADLEALGY